MEDFKEMMKKNIEISYTCDICKHKIKDDNSMVYFSRFCNSCNEREELFFCSDECFITFVNDFRKGGIAA